MANMSSISCATTCGRRLPVSARKGSRAAPSATRDGASYPQYAFQAAAISGFTSRITQQPIGRATERAAGGGSRLAGRPIGRIVGAEAVKLGEWQQLHAESAKRFGVETAGWKGKHYGTCKERHAEVQHYGDRKEA